MTDWLAEGEKLLEDGFTLQVLAAWLKAAGLAEVAGGCRGPGSRGMAGSWLAGQLEKRGRWLLENLLAGGS